MKIAEVLIGIGRPIAYHPRLADAVGGVTTGVLLDQLLYWRGKGSNPEAVYKTSDEIREETGLTYREQLSARKRLKTLGILNERYDRLGHRTFFTVDIDELERVFTRWESTDGKRQRVNVPKTKKPNHDREGHRHNVTVGNVTKRRSGPSQCDRRDRNNPSVEDIDFIIDSAETTASPPSFRPPLRGGDGRSSDGSTTSSTPRKRYEKKAERDARLEQQRRRISRQADLLTASGFDTGTSEVRT